MSIRYKTLAATTRDTIETRASGEEQCKDLFELKQLHSIISNNATLQQQRMLSVRNIMATDVNRNLETIRTTIVSASNWQFESTSAMFF